LLEKLKPNFFKHVNLRKKQTFWVAGEGPTIVIGMKFTHKISNFGAFKNVSSKIN